MKTISKLILPVAILIGTIGTAQEKKTRICLKIDENKDGVVTKVDTCFESSDQAEIDAFLKKMGADDTHIVTTNTKGASKKVIIKNSEDKDGNKNEYTYTYSNDGDADANVMVFVDDKGNVTTTGAGANGARVIVKESDGNEKDIDKEIEELMKEVEKDGTIDVSENGKTKKKEVRVYVSRKVEINNISSEDKKAMPSNLQQIKGSSFDGLSLYPNPAKDNVTINYKGNTSEPLTIKLYDAQGKTILVEKEVNTDKEMTKKLNLEDLKKGIYFLHLEQGKKSEVKKLVVSE